MKLVSFSRNGHERLGLYHEGQVLDLEQAADYDDLKMASNMAKFLRKLDKYEDNARLIHGKFIEGKYKKGIYGLNEIQLLSPVPKPTSCRDGYAFRQHVEAARRNRGVEMIKEFDEYPIFYFTNHNAVMGPGEIPVMKDHLEKLDFELEVAAVIGKRGRNIPAEEADEYIFGYTIMNDMSARTLQMEEMLLNLGPAKGKDFSTVLGPWLVTRDELAPYRISAKDGHIGERYDLKMKCWVNEKQVSEGNTGDMDWTFAEIVERCAYGADILSGDVIGSGTVGTGCFLELNGTGLRLNPEFKPQWLQTGDTVTMEITGLGRLENTIVKEGDFSILDKKKRVSQI
jgi:fumarylacetoacetate (FAA) hydrolase